MVRTAKYNIILYPDMAKKRQMECDGDNGLTTGEDREFCIFKNGHNPVQHYAWHTMVTMTNMSLFITRLSTEAGS